jgi:hypothetical protein
MRRRNERDPDRRPTEVLVGQLRLQQDLTPADWLADRIERSRDLGEFVPDGFDAYARVLHPSYRQHDNHLVPIRWADLASSTGTTFHRQVQWNNIAGRRSWLNRPLEGSLPRALAERLVAVLAAHTSSPDVVWFAIWEGFGGLRFLSDDSSSYVVLKRQRFPSLSRLRIRFSRYHRPVPPAPRFHLPGRSYYLFRGPVGGASESFERRSSQSANLWWPDDHAWVVATEIDLNSTYIGGTQACIDTILASPAFEAVPADIHDKVGWDADTINPPPPDVNV